MTVTHPWHEEDQEDPVSKLEHEVVKSRILERLTGGATRVVLGRFELLRRIGSGGMAAFIEKPPPEWKK